MINLKLVNYYLSMKIIRDQFNRIIHTKRL